MFWQTTYWWRSVLSLFNAAWDVYGYNKHKAIRNQKYYRRPVWITSWRRLVCCFSLDWFGVDQIIDGRRPLLLWLGMSSNKRSAVKIECMFKTYICQFRLYWFGCGCSSRGNQWSCWWFQYHHGLQLNVMLTAVWMFICIYIRRKGKPNLNYLFWWAFYCFSTAPFQQTSWAVMREGSVVHTPHNRISISTSNKIL